MTSTRYANRIEAAEQLADAIAALGLQAPLVLGIPRGGVPMAAVVAERLSAPLDVVLVHKLRAPGNPEYAIGAVDESGHVALRASTGLTGHEPAVRKEIKTEQATLARRRRQYGQPAVDPAGRDVIIVDDGAATGATVQAAVEVLKKTAAATVTAALGVAPAEVVESLRQNADHVICPLMPEDFMSVGQFYGVFDPVSDETVAQTLQEHRRGHALSAPDDAREYPTRPH